MSLASVRPAEISSSLEYLSPRSLSAASLEDASSEAGYSFYMGGEDMHAFAHAHDAVLSIEELRAQLGSCFTCGVSWAQQHVSLDCGECGGYAMERPCPLCEATCSEKWKRDLTQSHACGKARWQGYCPLSARPGELQAHPPAPQRSAPAVPPPPPCSAAARLARDLCQRLEKLSAQEHSS